SFSFQKEQTTRLLVCCSVSVAEARLPAVAAPYLAPDFRLIDCRFVFSQKLTKSFSFYNDSCTTSLSIASISMFSFRLPAGLAAGRGGKSLQS
ncbi:MAG: hypothetical protein NC338_05155, partial [Firmicutes bacterium]|nr:hypothetical protein [Bacillota bacterium]